MLIGSGVRVYHGPVRAYGAALAASIDRGTIKPGGLRNLLAATDQKYGIPTTYRHPGAWVMPQKPGTLGSHRRAAGAGTLASGIAGGRNGEAALSGSGSVSATAQLIVSAVAALSGSGVITNADAKAYLNAAATLAGEGSLSAAAVAIGHAAAALAGTGSMNVTPRADGEMSANISNAAEGLTAASVANAVWDTPQGRFLYAIGHNKVITDPAAGTYTVYDTDDTTILYTADLWEDADGTVAYTGTGAQRRDRMT